MRTRIFTPALTVLCSGAFLLGCAGALPEPGQGTPAAVLKTADASYLRGRKLHLERRYDEAIAAYQAALRLDAGHVNASNGLATAYAEQRDFARAIPIWREMTRGAGLAAGQASAFLFANLGYAYFLNGEHDDAVVALEKACLLDPLNARPWQYLGATLQKLGQDERARQMLDQARALREHDFQDDYAAAGGGSRLPAIERAVQKAQTAQVVAPPPGPEWAVVQVADSGGGLLELRRVEPAAPPPTTPPVPVPAPGQPFIAAALEISNGNGRQGMARLLSRQIRDPGVKSVRLANEKNFRVRQTRIEYQPAFRDLAERLAQRLGNGAPVAVTSRMAGRADVRLVIGLDLPPHRLGGRPYMAPADRAGAP